MHLLQKESSRFWNSLATVEHIARARYHLVVMPITQVFLVFESTSGRVAAVPMLAPLGERFQGEEGEWESWGGAGSPEEMLLGQRVGTRHQKGGLFGEQLLPEGSTGFWGARVEASQSNAITGHAQRRSPDQPTGN